MSAQLTVAAGAASAATSLKTNLADYQVTMAMKDGRVTSDLVKLDYCGPKVANKAFKAMVRENAYDAGELAIITYLQARAWGKPFVLLPLPLSGRFQHHCIGFNQELGPLKPKDIEGRKVGLRTYSQTTALWVRGILQHEYGVDLDKVRWLTIEDAHVTEFHDPSNCQRLAAGSKLADMMLSGELTAAILGGDMPKDPRVQSLIPNAAAAAQEWYQREGVIPINHMFVVRAELSRERPEVVRDIYRMLVESRQFAAESATRPPVGLEANRKALELAIQWSYEQKLIPRRLSVDELFDDTTAALGT
jgi:4,5-dihydroxyphthalate decarboxylase